MSGPQETLRRPYIRRHLHDQQSRLDFFDIASIIAIKEGTEVEIRDFTLVESTGKDYLGPDITVLSLREAQERVSPEALERRISEQRKIITGVTDEIQRLEEIRKQLYGETQKQG